MNIDNIMKELAQYTRLQEEIANIIEGLKDQIKEYMIETGIDTLVSSEHKATYKTVKSNRIDTTALKKELPDIAAKFNKTTETKRFTFV